MRVVHFVRAFSPLSESFIYDHVTEMQRQGAECHILTMNRENLLARPFEPVTKLNIPSKVNLRRAFYKAVGYTVGRENSTYLWPIYRGELHRELRKIAPDVIHAHFGPEGAIVAPVAQQLGIPLVVTFYGYDVSRLAMSEKWRHRYSELFARVAQLIGVSRPVCERLIALGADPAKVRLIHLGVRLDKFAYSNPLGRFDGKTVRCIHVGRLTPKKAPLHLLKAFSLAVAATAPGVDLKLTIIGEGELAAEVRSRITALELESRVEMLGALPHDQIVSHLRQAHIYTQHSLTAPNGDQEGLPVSVIEASASGLPVVSTMHSGIPEAVLDGKTGFLVAEGDVEAMSERIATLSQNPELWLRFGMAGRCHIQRGFNLTDLVSESTRLLECLVSS